MSKMSLEQIEAELEAVRSREKVLVQAWRSLKHEDFTERMDKLFHDGEITLERVMGLDWYELGNITYPTQWGKDIHKWLDDECWHGSLKGLYSSGISAQNQPGFQIGINSNDPLDTQKGFLAVLPFLKPDEHGEKAITLFCRQEVVVAFDNDTQFRLEGSYQTKKGQTFTGMGILEFIQKNFPYGNDED